VATLPHDRSLALGELDACFRGGEAPGPLEGPHAGRLLTTTVGSALDPIFVGMARAWLPWKGKTFMPAFGEGRNLFTPEFRIPMRLFWPGYEDIRREPAGWFSTFRFDTRVGGGVLAPDTQVLKIDYAHEESPWLVRSILDELVRIDEGLYLGQALMRWRGRTRRVAWFSLSA
jgi:hypothetical protein